MCVFNHTHLVFFSWSFRASLSHSLSQWNYKIINEKFYACIKSPLDIVLYSFLVYIMHVCVLMVANFTQKFCTREKFWGWSFSASRTSCNAQSYVCIGKGAKVVEECEMMRKKVSRFRSFRLIHTNCSSTAEKESNENLCKKDFFFMLFFYIIWGTWLYACSFSIIAIVKLQFWNLRPTRKV